MTQTATPQRDMGLRGLPYRAPCRKTIPWAVKFLAKSSGYPTWRSVLLLGFALAILSVVAGLDAAENAGWYGGFNIGRSYAKIDDARIARSLSAGGATMTSIRDDDRDTAYKLFGGYRFGSRVALEGGYFDLRKSGFTATTLPSGTLSGDLRVRGANLDLLGLLPLRGGLAAFGRVGATRAQTRDTFTATGVIRVLEPTAATSATNYKVGVGLEYNLFRSLGVRAEAERYRIDDAVGNRGDIDLYSVGVQYRFGRAASPWAALPGAPAAVDRRFHAGRVTYNDSTRDINSTAPSTR